MVRNIHWLTIRSVSVMPRKSIFTLLASDHGALIVNRMDCRAVSATHAVGVGIELLETSRYQMREVETALGILQLRRRYYGAGVTAIDGGANIGVHTVEWAKAMSDWGRVLAIEPQERLFYALAGNIALNNCANAGAMNAALSDVSSFIEMPVPDYEVPANFGGLSLINENDIGQDMTRRVMVRGVALDDLKLDRLDFLKLDIEGMELMALTGAKHTIEACHPVVQAEHSVCGKELLQEWFASRRYELFQFGGNFICVHELDKVLEHIRGLHRVLLQENFERDFAEKEEAA
jgi:FkbM family methyltransferase